tara:strand:- start:204 stop:365 length:162 start_codon:yes stop_codon:yes gene_type:complete
VEAVEVAHQIQAVLEHQVKAMLVVMEQVMVGAAEAELELWGLMEVEPMVELVV